ncbi:MAG TPA: hypothetical protein VHL05_06365 [Terriglobales bacterium]|nr:hypothetical protein [Terriglobales bacterium]HMC73317.1 hypothetical protein [Terriglobales bacterium]
MSFKVNDSLKEGILKEVRAGLVWRDFFLEDGRVVPEHKVVGCPESLSWRDPDTVSAEERRSWERRMVTMAEAGIDPHDREHELWADLTQYLAYTYLRFKKVKTIPRDAA